MVNWKFWERGDTELGLPSLSNGSSSASGLDFAQHYEPPTADPFASGAQSFGNMNPNIPQAPSLGAPSPFTPTPYAPSGQSQSPFQPSAFNQLSQQSLAAPDEHASALPSKDLEVIGAKLDAIRSQLETMNMRMTLIEQRLPPQGIDAQNPRRPWY